MSYSIEKVEGIGPTLGTKLTNAGIKTTKALLEHAKTPASRKALAQKSGLTDTQILTFANMADLFRVKGVASQFAELLVAAGVDTVKELAARRSDNLTAKMKEINNQKKLTRRVPTQREVDDWIAQAGKLPRAMEY